MKHQAQHHTLKAGIPALNRLINFAQGDTGQTFPSLDHELSIAPLRMDAGATQKEVHQYINGGQSLFDQFAKIEG